MTHNTDADRLEFEAWAQSQWRGINLAWMIDFSKCADFDTNTKWLTWRASRRAQVVPDAYLVYAKGSTRYWVVTLNPDDVPEIYKGGETVPLYRHAAAPQPPT